MNTATENVRLPEASGGREVFFHSLDYSTTPDELHAFLQSKIGGVVQVSMPAGADGKPNRGFAFVRFQNENYGQLAVDDDANLMLRGRTIRIAWALPKEQHHQRQQRRGAAR